MSYVSPMVRARAIVAGEMGEVSYFQRQIAQRMVRLSPTIVADLESEEAPVHVFRWVAWAATLTEQRRRTDLVVHLRRSIERPRNGWLQERHFYAALDVWDQARSAARKRGGIMPAVHEIPDDTYRTAIEGARRRPRSQETEMAMAESAAVTADSAAAESSAFEPDDETEEAPISTRQPLKGRDHVLRVLSDTAREAIAADDKEAADAANSAISWLCGGRKAG